MGTVGKIRYRHSSGVGHGAFLLFHFLLSMQFMSRVRRAALYSDKHTPRSRNSCVPDLEIPVTRHLCYLSATYVEGMRAGPMARDTMREANDTERRPTGGRR